MDWRIAAHKYLDRLGKAEYDLFLAVGGRVGEYRPSDYHKDLIDLLSMDDEPGFKALKMQRGPYSPVGF